MAAAAQNALPGDALYAVKTAIEDVRLAISPDNASKAQLHLAFARTRVDEIAALAAKGQYSDIPQTVVAFESQVQAAALTVSAVAEEDTAQGVALARRAERDLSDYTGALAVLRGPALKRLGL